MKRRPPTTSAAASPTPNHPSALTPFARAWQGLENLLERDVVPDAVIRLGIRAILGSRRREILRGDVAERLDRHRRFLRRLERGPIAIATDTANEQHYEVPARFFELVLGSRLKYSCAYWPPGVETLDRAEEEMLDLSARRAGLADGQRILDFGSGWGSMALYAAGRFPGSRVTAVSNSETQKAYVDARRRERGLDNLEVVCAEAADYTPAGRFDRIVSIEMFEHVRNHRELLRRISSWLEPDGRLFVHVFANLHTAYPFEDRGPSDWMARHFFTGGIMPSDDFFLHFQEDLVVRDRWRVAGCHYARTCGAWLRNMDRRRSEILALFREAYGAGEEIRWWARWRLFFLACQELFACGGGGEWFVTHTVMSPR